MRKIRRKIWSVLSINLTLFDIEIQNLKFRSITKTVLDKSKKKKHFENFLELDAQQYCRN